LKKRILSVLLGCFLTFAILPSSAQSGATWIVPDAAANFYPGVNLANSSSLINGQAMNVTGLTVTGGNSNVFTLSDFQMFNSTNIIDISASLPFSSPRSSGATLSIDWAGGNSWNSGFSLGDVAVPAAVPAAPSDSGSFTFNTVPTWQGTGFLRPTSTADSVTLAVARPDFNYVSQKLEFEKVLDSSTTGQRDLEVGAGNPVGIPRFIPIGEF
jgi:hypothetical protein